VAPGSFFGPAGEGYVRISATAPTERVREAMQRLGQFAVSSSMSPNN
jgi:LL-diaminopimelate aminotransferase